MTDWLKVCLVWASKGIAFGTLGVLVLGLASRIGRRSEGEVRR
jgi:hypothetical protein